MPLTSVVPAGELSSKTLRGSDYVFQSLKAHLVAKLRDIHRRRKHHMAHLRGLDEEEARILASFK